MNIHWNVTVYFVFINLRIHRFRNEPLIVGFDRYEIISIRKNSMERFQGNHWWILNRRSPSSNVNSFHSLDCHWWRNGESADQGSRGNFTEHLTADKYHPVFSISRQCGAFSTNEIQGQVSKIEIPWLNQWDISTCYILHRPWHNTKVTTSP